MTAGKTALYSLAAGLIALAAWAVFTTSRTSAAGGLIPYDDIAAVASGEKLYDEHCAACHGAGREGEPNWRQRDAEGYLPAPPHDETGHSWHHPDQQLFEITKYGTEALVGGGYRSRMSGFGDTLDDADILAVLAFVKARWPPGIIARHNQINAANRAD